MTALGVNEDGTDKATVNYFFPLRRDLLVELELPADLTRADIMRLTRFLEALPFDDESEEEEPEGETLDADQLDAGEGEEDASECVDRAADGEELDESAEDDQSDGSEAALEGGNADEGEDPDEESAVDGPGAPIARLRAPLRALCALAKDPIAAKRKGRPAIPMAVTCEAVICKALLRAPARTVTRSVVPGLHYNSLIRALRDPSTTSAVRELYLIAQAALMRAKGEDGAPSDFYMKETLRNEERIVAYAERIGRILREAEDMELSLSFQPLPPRESGPTVPRGTTFEEALRRDPSLASRVRRP